MSPHTSVPPLWGGQDDLDTVFRTVETLTSVGATIGALEQLASSSTLADDGMFGWPVMKLRSPMWWRRLGPERLGKIFGYPNVVGLVQTRALAGLGLVLPGATRAQRGVLSATMCATAHGLHTRMAGYGLDGSDHLTFVNYAVSAAEKAFGHDPRAREALAKFLAAQVCMAYFTSGAAKLISPVWRDGTAIPEIFRTNMFGDSRFFEAVRDRPWLAKSVAWATILGEMAFPLVLVAPKPVARGILASGTAFHLANARFMGLNRFIWSYCSTYPALAHVSRSLGSTPAAPSAPAPTASVPTAPVPTALVRASEALRRPGVRRGAVLAGAGAAVLAGVAARQAARTRRERLTRSMPGRLVPVAGRNVHVLARTDAADAETDAGPTVVFENGLASPATEWGWVLKGLRPGTRYVAYDRPGTGWSDTVRRRQDADAASRDLLALLGELGVEPPYVLVGHSIGGLLVRSFARRHPELVGGLVLADASHPEQFRRSPRQREALPWIKQRMTTTYLQATAGLLRRSGRMDQMDTLPGEYAAATRDCMAHPRVWRTALRELDQSQRWWSPDAMRLEAGPAMPVAVLTAGETVRSDPTHTELQRELAQLSQVSRHDLVDEAGHETLVLAEQHAKHVVEAVEWVRAQHSTLGAAKGVRS
ncbi:alpha/beta fold hydrolase [Streptomyces sp. NPDC048172]|uniref:alpha/beta fold hydrolase n=1 Tax=Streptomyces sp. NPDC048172 TaxID=3365505 RepID=UPI00371F75C9